MKRLFSVFTTTFLMVTHLGCAAPPTPVDFFTPAVEGTQPPDSLEGPPVVSAAAWAIVDGKTGDLLWHFNGLKPRKAASTTKVMNVSLEIVEVSELAGNTTGSTAQLDPGDRVKVRELLYGFMLPSGNDAGNAFAEHFGNRFAKPNPGDPEYYEKLEGDTRQNFIAQMNRQAMLWGLSDTFYRSAYGDGGTNEEFTTTAADLACLAWHAYEIPRFSDIVKTRNHTGTLNNIDGSLRTVTWTNTNQLLNFEGFDGVKTGTTTAAGSCLVSHGTRGSDSLFIAVVGSTHNNYRYVDTRNLFRWAWLQRGHR
jgi:D-alanyl-D-alanine carboxypeptidase (penicillin-binding protein 5/6)